MPAKKCVVGLTGEERQKLLELTRKGNQSVRKVRRARILLKADEGWKDRESMAALDTSSARVEQARKGFVEGGLEKALNEDPRPGQRRKLDGRQEAHLIALACSEAPAGHSQWTLRLLADKLVELRVWILSHMRQYAKG